MKMDRLKDMFTLRTDSEIETELKTLMSRIADIGSALEESIASLERKDYQSLESSVKRIAALEKEVDDIRRNTEEDIYSRKSAIYNKAEKIELLETLDDIADAAQEASELLTIRKISLDKSLSDDFLNLASSTKKSIIALKHAVDSLFSDLSEVKKYDSLAEKERNNARAYHSRIMRNLFASDMDIRDIMLLKSASERIRNTADAAEIASDKLNYMAARYAVL